NLPSNTGTRLSDSLPRIAAAPVPSPEQPISQPAPARRPVQHQRRWGSSTVKTYPTANIRNVALVGHSGSGKTTLVEALLARSGATPRTGRVEDGTTVSDTEPE